MFPLTANFLSPWRPQSSSNYWEIMWIDVVRFYLRERLQLCGMILYLNVNISALLWSTFKYNRN